MAATPQEGPGCCLLPGQRSPAVSGQQETAVWVRLLVASTAHGLRSKAFMRGELQLQSRQASSGGREISGTCVLGL